MTDRVLIWFCDFEVFGFVQYGLCVLKECWLIPIVADGYVLCRILGKGLLVLIQDSAFVSCQILLQAISKCLVLNSLLSRP